MLVSAYRKCFVVGDVGLDDVNIVALAQLSLDLRVGGSLVSDKANDRNVALAGQLFEELKLVKISICLWGIPAGKPTPRPRETPVMRYEAIAY